MNVAPDVINSARNGDRKAQYLLYKQCFPVLMSVCARYRCGEQDAVSAVNAAYLKIIQNLEKYSEEVVFEAWIRRIQINVLIDEFRKNKKWISQVNVAEDMAAPSIQKWTEIQWNEADLKMEASYLERLLNRLPPVTCQVFNLFALEGFSHSEIGKMLGMSDGTSKWHVSSARSQLRAWLAEVKI
jgi:RNA polymerase sigma-70 factor (ECF subfamily)